MPVTPLHLGPGTVLKAGGGEYMSFTVFALSQIMMDVEVVGRLLVSAERLHGFTNTLGGATVVLVPAVFIGRPAYRGFLDWWNRHLSPAQSKLMSVDASISWKVASVGAMLGVYSHWFLDAMMHADARAMWPFSTGNPFISWLSIGELNALCVASLIVGCCALMIRMVWERAQNRANKGAGSDA